jgi:hypothetical protein
VQLKFYDLINIMFRHDPENPTLSQRTLQNKHPFPKRLLLIGGLWAGISIVSAGVDAASAAVHAEQGQQEINRQLEHDGIRLFIGEMAIVAALALTRQQKANSELA